MTFEQVFTSWMKSFHDPNPRGPQSINNLTIAYLFPSPASIFQTTNTIIIPKTKHPSRFTHRKNPKPFFEQQQRSKAKKPRTTCQQMPRHPHAWQCCQCSRTNDGFSDRRCCGRYDRNCSHTFCGYCVQFMDTDPPYDDGYPEWEKC